MENHSPKMALQFAARAAVDTAQPTAPLSQEAEGYLAKLDVRLVAILTEFQVQPITMAALGKVGIVSLPLFAALADQKEQFRPAITLIVGLDPLSGPQESMEMARLSAAFNSGRIRAEVEAKIDAEHAANFLPILVSASEIDQMRKAFERMEGLPENSIHEEIAPGKVYFERKLGELTSCFEAEHLSLVTTKAMDEMLISKGTGVDPTSGVFKICTKTTAIELPKGSEELRWRLKTMGILWCYLKMRAPNRRALSTISMEAWRNYQEWLFGPDVWAMAQRDMNRRVLSTPTLDNVLLFEMATRKKIMDKMNSQIDFVTAFEQVKSDTNHIFVNFIAQVSQNKVQTITAPGLAAASSSGTQREWRPDPPGGKAKKESKVQKARRQLRELKDSVPVKQLAIKDKSHGGGAGGVKKGDGKGAKKGAGKGDKGKKGAGKVDRVPAGAHSKTADGPDGLAICFGHNLGTCTRGVADCHFSHTCWFCRGTGCARCPAA